jgi:hypothetical protein
MSFEEEARYSVVSVRTRFANERAANARVVAVAQFSREAKATVRPYFHQVEGSGEGEKAVDVGMVLWTELGKGQSGARPATIFVDYNAMRMLAREPD